MDFLDEQDNAHVIASILSPSLSPRLLLLAGRVDDVLDAAEASAVAHVVAVAGLE